MPAVILLQVFNKQFWFQGILEPLTHLERSGKISMGLGIIVIDGLCEAEHHRPDYGDTIASFFCKQINNFPSWLKVVVTVRSSLSDICRVLPFHRIRWKSYIVLKARIFYIYLNEGDTTFSCLKLSNIWMTNKQALVKWWIIKVTFWFTEVEVFCWHHFNFGLGFLLKVSFLEIWEKNLCFTLIKLCFAFAKLHVCNYNID